MLIDEFDLLIDEFDMICCCSQLSGKAIRPRSRWEDNIKMDLQEVGCGGVGWIELKKYNNYMAIMASGEV
jgi:hypothetical protein